MRQITAVQLKKFLEQTEDPPVLLDIREPWEFQTCHIEGAIHIPMGQIPTAYKDLDADKQTVVICHHGMRSQQVAQFLEKAGFTNVINLTGGVDAWARDVDPDMPVY
jgi:rhodanese-related sulfurtransferase